MKISSTTARPFLIAALAIAGSVASTGASAQFAPRVSSDDIEGAVMPAVPFPLNDRTAATSQQPQSMGLAPSVPSVESSQREPAQAMPKLGTRPILSAQDLADRLLNR